MFEKPELTPIIGEPTYETIERLLKELKANHKPIIGRVDIGNRAIWRKVVIGAPQIEYG